MSIQLRCYPPRRPFKNCISRVKKLGFKATVNRPSKTDQTQPDYLLKGSDNGRLTAAFVYAWDRWLDGPDLNDADTPEENPGACVVTALDQGTADWIIVTNGRLWRLYSRRAHARATNFYEVDLAEALTASGDTDPNEAFRYWWLFLRAAAFRPQAEGKGCWLDVILLGSREYAKRLGDRLKDRIFLTIFPHLAQGFLQDRKHRLGQGKAPPEEERADIFEATLTLLYRLLFLLYAESRDLLPIREAPYFAAGLKKIKEEIAERAGVAEGDVAERLQKAYSAKETTLYERLYCLFRAMDKGDPVLNVPIYNGGLFNTSPDGSEQREQGIARFLLDHKVPDRYLALAIDRLARDQDERTLDLVSIDYKSLEVRHLGSIYEGLLEFKLKVADEDLTTQGDKRGEKYIPLSKVKASGRRKPADVVVRKNEVYLSNDKAQRKASGSYYTPDPIVEYIVAQTVGPVLQEKLDSLRADFRHVRKTYDRHRQNAAAHPGLALGSAAKDPRRFALDKTYAEHKDLVARLFDFRVLDPATGSGHFLVEAVDFITDRLLDFLNAFPINPVTVALERTRASILAAAAEQGVSVDPDRLTDVNLLKRHVLKRCVYGVDINPMAVELAKVSLWLDAFTLGAPLSFLDHHVRSGNSLVGATFAELKDFTKDRFFSLDYQPMLEAIRNVLFVSKLADATAAEVKSSAAQYGRAREELSGYQVVLDLLAARHFGLARATALLTDASDLKLETRERLLEFLPDDADRELVEQATRLARQPGLQFFHWEVEFPEVYFGFLDWDQRQLRHKEDLADGSAGFDAIVGNPPYVRQEAIKQLKPFLKTCYQTFDSTSDLYVYFQEQEVRNLRAGGRMGMIVANKWMRAGYGRKARDFLKRVARPVEVVDFGHAPIFPDADTFPCILVVARRPLSDSAPTAGPVRSARVSDPTETPDRRSPPSEETVDACSVPRDDWHDRMNLLDYVLPRRSRVPTRLLRDDGWSLEDPRVQALLEKIRNTGVPLKEYCGSSPFRGILTGFNEAFIVDAATRDRLIREDPRCEPLLRPLLRGRDIDRWRPRPSGVYLITIASSENHSWPWSDAGAKAESRFRKAFPSLHAHLAPFEEPLRQRQDQGRYWWELRSCDYLVEFEKPKLVWQEIQFHSWFALDQSKALVNNKVYFLPSTDIALLGVLCSPLMWWQLTRVLPHMKDEALSPAAFLMENLCVTTGTSSQHKALSDVAEPLLEHAADFHGWEDAILREAQDRWDIPVGDDRLIHNLDLDADSFVARLASLSGKKAFAPAEKAFIEIFRQNAHARRTELLKRQMEMERPLAVLVEHAYGLSGEERDLVRSTRPVRDPIDVLEAKIRGPADEAPLGE